MATMSLGGFCDGSAGFEITTSERSAKAIKPDRIEPNPLPEGKWVQSRRIAWQCERRTATEGQRRTRGLAEKIPLMVTLSSASVSLKVVENKFLRLLNIAGLLTALLPVSSQAVAETQLIELPSRYLVIPPSEAFTKRLRVAEDVLNVPLRWESAAVLDQPVDVAADDRRVRLAKGQALVATRLRFDDPKFSQAGAFCVPRVADPIRKNGLLALGVFGAMLARSTTDGQFCLVDIDRDGLADHSVLINAGSPAARTPAPIAASPYTLTSGAPVSEGDSFRVFYRGGTYFEIAVIQQGHARQFDTLTFKGPSGKESYRKGLRVVKMPDGSVQVPVPGAVFTAKNYDKKSQTIEISWPYVSRPMTYPIPDVVKASNGISY